MRDKLLKLDDNVLRQLEQLASKLRVSCCEYIRIVLKNHLEGIKDDETFKKILNLNNDNINHKKYANAVRAWPHLEHTIASNNAKILANYNPAIPTFDNIILEIKSLAILNRLKNAYTELGFIVEMNPESFLQGFMRIKKYENNI